MMFGFNAHEVFQIAVEIEENGKTFYEKAARMVRDPAVRDIFLDLAEEEVSHKRLFLELKESLPDPPPGQAVWDPDNEMEQYLKMMADQHVFRTAQGVEERLAGVSSAVDALRMAIDFEKDSVLFFLSMQEVTDREEDRRLIGRLVKEEQDHLRRLSLQLRKTIQ